MQLTSKKEVNFESVLKKVMYLGLATYFIFFIVNSAFCIIYPYQIDYGEGFLLNQAKLISSGNWIYKDINEPPFLMSNYPPIYPAVVSLFILFFGVSFMWGRLISAISTFITGLLIYKIVSKKTDRDIGLISFLIFFSSPYIFQWGPLHRVDMLALCFSLAGIYLLSQASITPQRVYLSVLFFILATFTKQSFFAAPIAAVLYLYFKDSKMALKFGFSFITIYLTMFLIIDHSTEGKFHLNTIICNINIFSFYQAIIYLVKFIWTHGLIVLLGFWFVISSSISKLKSELLSLYSILAFCFSFTVGKVGSSINYFVETIAVFCIIFGLSLKKIEIFRLNSDLNFKKFLYIAILIQLVSFAHLPFTYPSLEDLKNEKILSEKIQRYERILSEDGGILVVNGKDVVFQPFEFTQLSIQGIWDQGKILQEIDKKKFDLIILEFNVFDLPTKNERFTNEMIQLIRSNYCFSEKIGRKYLYEPCI